MKYKLPFIFTFGIIIWLLIPLSKSYASLNDGGYTNWFLCPAGDGLYKFYVISYNQPQTLNYSHWNNNSFTISGSGFQGALYQAYWTDTDNHTHPFGAIGQFLYANDAHTLATYNVGVLGTDFQGPVYSNNITWNCINGTPIEGMGEGPPPEPEPTWWENIGDWVSGFFEYVGDVAYDIWNTLFPSEDILDWDSLDIVDSPSMTPLPTEIPYSTIIDPTTGEIQYKYEVSGTPIITSQPPPVATYIITLPPDQGIAMPSGVVYPDDGLQDVIDAIDDNVIDYSDGIETIRDSFSTLPIKWFAFFGIPAAILIIAGVIKSLLG